MLFYGPAHNELHFDEGAFVRGGLILHVGRIEILFGAANDYCAFAVPLPLPRTV
jgi:hypothetical protein